MTDRLGSISCDDSLGAGNDNAAHERAVAIFDLMQGNSFSPEGFAGKGPFTLLLGLVDQKLMFNLRDHAGAALPVIIVPMSAFKRVLKDYFLLCDSYHEAVRNAPHDVIAQLDHERRRLHDDGAAILADKLKGRAHLDHETARRLFTLISALHWKG